MFVKTIHEGRETLYECRHVTQTNVPGTPAIVIEVTPGPTVLLDKPGDALYIMNAEGDTIDSWRYVVREEPPTTFLPPMLLPDNSTGGGQ